MGAPETLSFTYICIPNGKQREREAACPALNNSKRLRVSAMHAPLPRKNGA